MANSEIMVKRGGVMWNAGATIEFEHDIDEVKLLAKVLLAQRNSLINTLREIQGLPSNRDDESSQIAFIAIKKIKAGE